MLSAFRLSTRPHCLRKRLTGIAADFAPALGVSFVSTPGAQAVTEHVTSRRQLPMHPRKIRLARNPLTKFNYITVEFQARVFMPAR